MTIAVCFLAMLAAALLGTIEGDEPLILVAMGASFLAGTIILARRTALQKLGTARTPCVLLFSLTVAHIFVGFMLADLTTQHTSIRSNGEVFFANAMLINCVGLFAGAVGYAWKLQNKSAGVVPGIPMVINPDRSERIFRALLVIGSTLMFFASWKLGVMEYLYEPAKWPFIRYVTGDFLGGSATDEWLINRALDLITVSLPMILIRTWKRIGVCNVLLALIGSLALLLPLRRANLLAVALTCLILVGIEKANVYRLTRRVILSGAVVYVVSQCIFLIGVFADDISPRQFLTVSSTALPEVRDLGWTLSLLDGEKLNGVTFAQALIPLPSIASDWSSSHSLRSISTKLIGLDQTGQTGGLRLTIMGEGYINFGYLGAIAAGFIWGIAVGWSEQLLKVAGKRKPEFVNYAAAVCFSWICFWVYLAGTQAAASIKVGAILLLGIAWASNLRLVDTRLRSLQLT